MNDEPPDFSVSFAVPGAADAARKAHAQLPTGADAALLLKAAASQDPIANALQVTLTAGEQLAPSGPAVLRVDLTSIIDPAAVAEVEVTEADVGWKLSPPGGARAAVVLTSTGPIDANETSLTLSPLVVTGEKIRQPVVSFGPVGGDPAGPSAQTGLAVVDMPAPGLQPLGVTVAWVPGAEHPVLIGEPGLLNPSRPEILIAGDVDPKAGGTVTLWFQAVDDATAPPRTSLGRHSEVSTFGFAVTGGLVSWAAATDPELPSWTFSAAPGKALLPGKQAHLQLTGTLGFGPPDMPNLPGTALLFVKIDVPGYVPHLGVLMLAKSKPITSVSVTACETGTPHAVPVFPQATGVHLMDLGGAAQGTVDVTLTVDVEEGSVNDLRLSHRDDAAPRAAILRPLSAGEDPELARGAFSLPQTALPAPDEYTLIASQGGTQVAQQPLALGVVSLVPGATLTKLKLVELVRDHLDLTRAELSFADLSRSRLPDAVMDGITATHLVATGAHLDRASLAGATLTSANLRGAILAHADLSGADLTGADVGDAVLDHVRLGHCTGLATVTGLDPRLILVNRLMGLPPAPPEAEGVAPRGAPRSTLRLAGLDLTGLDLSGADLWHADLNGAQLTDSNLTGANLVGADLRGAELSGAILTGANLALADLAGATGVRDAVGVSDATINVWLLATKGWTGAGVTNLATTGLDGACLRGADLEGGSFNGISMVGADLSEAKLAGCDFTGAVLIDASFLGAWTGGVKSWKGANLSGAAVDYTVGPTPGSALAWPDADPGPG